MNILIINGSLGGKDGNTSVLIKTAINDLAKHAVNTKTLHLEERIEKEESNELENILSWADGFIFTSGTYWDSWGSPMQKFLEQTTKYEASNLFLFKPASVMITMHSFGGKEVLSRLQGVLNTIGMIIPPMSGLVYSLSNHLAINSKEESKGEDNFNDDFWSLDDIEVTTHNLITAVNGKKNFKSWPVDRKDPKRRWL